MDRIVKAADTYTELKNRLEKLDSNAVFQNWLNKRDVEISDRYNREMGSVLTKLRSLRNLIKAQIDRLVIEEQMNFIEIEKHLRDKDSSVYIIAESSDKELAGCRVLDCDGEPTEIKTDILITDNEQELWEFMGASTKEEYIKKAELNLNMLVKAGVVVVENEEDLKKDITTKYQQYNAQLADLNDY